MVGAVYFPTLETPPASWLARELVLWDAIAVVLPYSPSPRTAGFDALFAPLQRSAAGIRYGVSAVHQLFGDAFGRYVSSLSSDELERRRDAFAAGAAVELFDEPYMWWALSQVIYDCGVVKLVGESALLVEDTTARELAAGLALGVCHPMCDLSYYAQKEIGVGAWLPVTDNWRSFLALCSPVPAHRLGGRSRFGRQMRDSDVRCVSLPNRSPLPGVPTDVESALDLRRRTGRSLRHEHLAWISRAVLTAINDPSVPSSDTSSRAAGLVAVDRESGEVELIAYYSGMDASDEDIANVGPATLAQFIDEGLGTYDGYGEHWVPRDEEESSKMKHALSENDKLHKD